MQKLSGMAAQLLGSDADAPAETAAPPRGTDAARIQLLHALRPFLSENTRAQIAHAERILSGAYDKNSRPAGSSAGRPHKGVVAHV